MCSQCGARFLVEYQPGGPFMVVKSTDGTRVIMDSFKDELEAALFANQLHADRLRARNFWTDPFLDYIIGKPEAGDL